MTDPHSLLDGPPRYLPPELVDLLRGLVGGMSDAALRLALRKWGEACFEAGYGLAMDDPTPDDERRITGPNLRTTGYGYVKITPPRPRPQSDTPAFDALRGPDHREIP